MFEEFGNYSYILTACLLIGVYQLTTFTLSLASLVSDLFILPLTNYEKYGGKKNCWAIVTGSSDGLGLEYASQLASKGFNIVLASRTLSKLEKISDELVAQYRVDTKVIAVDVTDDNAVSTIVSQLKGLPISILINNVGQSHSIPVPFVETDAQELDSIIKINNIFTLKLTQAVIPLIETTITDKNVKGLILTMGSFGGLLPTPYLATYSGSKAFLQNWSNCLSTELAAKKIDVEFIISYLVASSMSKIKRTSATIPNPKQFVKATLNKLNRRNGAQERFGTNTPFWSHALMHFGIAHLVGIYSKLANQLNFSMHKDIRRRALRKAERLAKEKAKVE